MTRTVRMALNAGTVRGVQISPPIVEAPDRIPVTEGQKRGIIDPLSALLMPVPAISRLSGRRHATAPSRSTTVITRFDVTLAFEGVGKVAARGYKGPVSFAPPATCRSRGIGRSAGDAVHGQQPRYGSLARADGETRDHGAVQDFRRDTRRHNGDRGAGIFGYARPTRRQRRALEPKTAPNRDRGLNAIRLRPTSNLRRDSISGARWGADACPWRQQGRNCARSAIRAPCVPVSVSKVNAAVRKIFRTSDVNR